MTIDKLNLIQEKHVATGNIIDDMSNSEKNRITFAREISSKLA